MGADLAVVVFSDACELPVLRPLARGYRHCFVVLRRGGAWVVVDPLAHRTVIDLVPGSLAREAEAVAGLYRAEGLIAEVVAVAEPPRRLAPLRPHTCVEVVKRLIGRRAPWVVTPAQLHRHLQAERHKCKKEEFMLDGGPAAAYD
ncbi:hypothetical protein ACM64Y_11055 [Novispirillum sp. DQ9]|uniref:hypothetical protein n=1 Tax=Novispirillum sp. DQ9 TaxID=3398612 RepID=UPI003C7C59E7